MTPERRNYRLYKAKKQWITACATFMLTFGITAVVNTSVQADTTDSEPSTSVVGSSAANSSATTGSADSTAINSNSANTETEATKAKNVTSDSETVVTSSSNEGSSVSTSASTSGASSASSTVTSAPSAKPASDSGASTASSDGSSVSSISTSAAPASSTPTSASPAKSASNSEPTTNTLKVNSNAAQTSGSASATSAELTAQKTADNDIKPIAYTTQERATVSQGYQLTDADAARFIQNASDLEKAGAKLSWESTPDTSGSSNSTVTSTGNVVVTYKDGTKTVVPVSFYVDQHVALNQLSNKGGYNYYYIDQVGENVTSMDTPDDNGNVLFDPNDQVGSKHSLVSVLNTVGSNTPQDYKFSLSQPLDTSTKGIHWATVNVDVSHVSTTGTFGNVLGNYTIKVPYIVQGLNLKKGIPVDSHGNPVITAQLESDETQKTLGFDPTQNASSLGQYFYQDYDLAYALGIRTTVTDFTKPTDLVNTKSNNFKMVLSGLGSQTAQTVAVNYATNATMDDYYFFNQKGFMPSGKPYIYGQSRMQNRNYLNEVFNGTNDDVNHLGKATVNGQKISSTLIDHVGSNWLSGSGSNGIFNLNLRLTFDRINNSGQPIIFSNSSFKINNQVAGTDDFVNSVNKWTNDLYVTPKTGVALQLAKAGATTYVGVKTNTDGKQLHAIILYPSEKTTKVDVDVTNNKFDLNTALAPLIQNPTNADGKHPLSQPILDNNTTWPAGTTFKFVSGDGQEVPVKAGQTYTGKIVVTLPGGSQGTVENISFHTKANVLTQDKSVYKGTTLTAKDLVTNADVFPDGTTFQFANNSEPNWNTPGTYDAQITATYPDHTQATSSATVTVKNTTTDPAKSKVTVSDKMQFTITYWDDTDNKQLQKFDMNEKDQGYDPHMQQQFTFDVSHYQSVSVTGVPDGVTITASDGKAFDDPAANYAIPNYKWTTAGAANLFGANITIHLKHKIQNVENNNLSQSERTATVKYVNGSTGESMGSLASDVQITTYYKRTVQQDLATGQYIYGPWQVDTSKGKQHGYNTDSNAVTISNSTVSVTVPTVAGYTPSQSGTVVIGENGALPATTTITYTANPQQFTIHYVDDDDNGKSVSDQVVNGVTGQTLTNNSDTPSDNFVKIPENYQLANGQTEPTSYTFSASNNPDITIHLAHKFEQQIRTITVNYTKVKVNADGTYTEEGQAADSAVLDVCYTTDLVTGKSLWDQSKNDDGYKNGYRVVSGTWTNLPQVWDISTPEKAAKSVVIANVPTLDGYTAYTGGPASNTNGVPANEFVYPAWNGSNGSISDTGKGAIAYTPNASIYEAQNIHTILYFSNQDLNQTQTRTVTRNYKYAETGSSKLDGTDVFSPAQVQVFYKRTGTFNSALNKMVYTEWTWDTSAGDTDTPGFHVISGNWNSSLGSKGKPIGNSPFSVNVPYKAGYTSVGVAQDATYNVLSLANPKQSGAYVDNTNNSYYWCGRNNQTIFYIPTSKLSKKVTRTINITAPDGTTSSTPQTVTLSRKAYLNNDATGQDTGVVFGDYKADTNWGAYTVPTQTDYKPVITQIVTNSDGTQTTTTLDSIPEQTVTVDTLPTTINVTYVPTTTQRNVTFKFVDDNNGGAQVGKLVTINGHAGETIDGLDKKGLVVPTNYKLADNQATLPTSYTFDSSVVHANVTIHLVHEIQNTTESQTRTITVHFKNVDTGKPVANDAKVDVFYKRSVTKDLATGKETDGDWTWDTTAKGSDEGTPGFHVISGSWNLPKNGQATTFGVIAPDLSNDYIAVSQSTGIYSTVTFATPTIANAFTNNTDPAWYFRNELTTYYVPKKKITRTINITKPGENQSTPIVQTVTITRNAKVNSDDSGVVYQGNPTITGSWDAYTVLVIQGYTAKITQTVNGQTTDITSIDAVTVDPNKTKDVKIDITYTANKGTQTINCVDSKGNVIGQQTINGKTDESVKVNPTLPTGWVLTNDSGMPDKVTIQPSDTPISVKIQHGSREVQPTDSVKDNEKTPTGEVINGGHESDLNQTITRTITVNTPKAKPSVITQIAHISRIGHVDLVTGEVTYDAWSTDNTNWTEYDVPAVAGYTASQAKVAAQAVTDGTKDVKIDITYTQNVYSTTINYVDENGKIVKTNTISGHIGDPIKVTIPKGYHVEGGNVPTLTIDPKNPVQKVMVTKDVHKTDTDPTIIDNPVLNIIKYVDENGNVIKTDHVAGKLGEPIALSLPAGYHFKDGKTPHLVIIESGVQTVNVEKDQHNTDNPQPSEKDTANIIKYVDENGNVIKTDHVTGKLPLVFQLVTTSKMARRHTW